MATIGKIKKKGALQPSKLSFCHRGAALSYRIALWHPDLISHLFTVCVPYARPQPTYLSIEDLVNNSASHFRYQIQFADGDVEKVVHTKSDIKQFLAAMYGGRTEKGEVGFDAEKGVLLDKLPSLKPSRLLSEEVRKHS